MQQEKFKLVEWVSLRRFTYEFLAKALNVHPNTISNWIKDPGRIPIAKAKELATLIGVDVDDIIFLP